MEQKEIRHRVIRLFRLADQALKRVVSKKVEGTGLYRSQHRLLMILGKHPDSSQSAIAEKMDISPAAVAVTLKKLEKGGYINRQCFAEDNRMNHVELTQKGQAAFNQSIRCFQEIEDAVFEGFSAEELELVESFFHRIIKNEENYYRMLGLEAQKLK